MHSSTALRRLRLQSRRTQDDLDRFIPNRSAMDFDYAHVMLTERRNRVEKSDIPRSVSSEAYQKLLAEALNMNKTRILAFKKKPSTLDGYGMIDRELGSSFQSKPTKKKRHIPQTAERELDAPYILDDFSLNLLDWGCNNVLAISLNDTVYLWNDSSGSVSELVAVDNEEAPITSVSWAPDGRRLAIGLNNSHVQLWDCQDERMVTTLRGGHLQGNRVASLAWNKDILTTGGMDGRIVNNDVRVQEHVVECYKEHQLEVCGLKWSSSGQQLASGGNDNLLCIWDRSMASSNRGTRCLHRLQDHTAAVKALAWCPFQGNLLASGGGEGDQCIRFWNTCTGACLNSVGTGSQVCALLWNKNEHELLSSHGFPDNLLILWKYPSMKTLAQLRGHTSRVLNMAESPNGYRVETAAGDESVRLWNVFETPEATKPSPKLKPEPFANVTRIR